MLCVLLMIFAISGPNAYALTFFPPDSKPYGLEYSEYGKIYWKWLVGLDDDGHPILDRTGEFCSNGQNISSFPVFFITGGGGGAVDRVCHVPEGKSLLIMLSSAEFSEIESDFQGIDSKLIEDTLIEAARTDQDKLNGLTLNINGTVYSQPELEKYRTSTGIFKAYFADNSLFETVPGAVPGTWRVASDNLYVITEPLKEGTYDIIVKGALCYPCLYSWDLGYRLIVSK